MKRGTKLLILLLVLILVCAAALLVTKLAGKNDTAEDADGEESLEQEGETVFSIAYSDMTAVSWTRDGKTLSFSKTKTGWVNDDDPTFPVGDYGISSAYTGLSNVLAVRTIEDVEDLSLYGFDEPECAITVTAGETYTLLLGDETSTGGQRYLNLGDDTVYIMNDTMLTYFPSDVYEMIQKESTPDMVIVESMTVKGSGLDLTILRDTSGERAYSADYKWFLVTAEGDKPLSTEKTEEFIEYFSDLNYGKCLTHQAEDLSIYGLGEPAYTVTLTYQDADGNVLEYTEEFGDKDESGWYYGHVPGSKMVYLVNTTVMGSLTEFSEEDILSTEILNVDWSLVKSVDITLDGQTKTATRESADAAWMCEGKEVSLDTVFSGLNAMASAGSPTGSSYGKTDVISFTIHQDKANFEEVALTFRTYDDTYNVSELYGRKLLCPKSTVDTIVDMVKGQLF